MNEMTRLHESEEEHAQDESEQEELHQEKRFVK